VAPVYPREARIAHIEGQVKLFLLAAEDGTIADLQSVSGNSLLTDSALKAVRQWRFAQLLGGVVGDNRKPLEYEIPITFTFSIEEPPKPAYLHLTDGTVIRADEVREYTDGIEYTVGHKVERIPSDSVETINRCRRVVAYLSEDPADCVAGGGPTFDIRAIPLLPAAKKNPAVSH
jgi:TonB family protein